MFDDADCARMRRESLPAINKYLADERTGGPWYIVESAYYLFQYPAILNISRWAALF